MGLVCSGYFKPIDSNHGTHRCACDLREIFYLWESHGILTRKAREGNT